MPTVGFDALETGMAIARDRAAALSIDAAKARAPGFRPFDVAAEPAGESGIAERVVTAKPLGASGAIEYAMGATAENSIRFRALADQERAMLREFRTVTDEARR
jgi:hypothetical protein